MTRTQKEQISLISRDVDAIKNVLLGDEYVQGMVDRVNQINTRLCHVERTLDRLRFLLIGVSLFGLSSLYDLIKALIHAF
ncbi:MAG: hypothetical protein OXB93_03440 [Cytophagales bacterium]|nr:hypothetical protein [Cytophagales bacterium]